MNRQTLRVLLVASGGERDGASLSDLLAHAPSLVVAASTAHGVDDAIAALVAQPFDVVLLDVPHAAASSSDVARLHNAAPQAAIVVLASTDDETALESGALAAMAAGAEECIGKSDLTAPLLTRAIRYALQRKRAEENVRRLVREQAARAQAEAAERRARFLAETTRALADTLGFDPTIAVAARAMVPMLADLAIVDVIDDGGDVRRAVAAVGSSQTNAIDGVLDLLPQMNGESAPITRAIRSGEPVFIPELDDETRAALGRDHEPVSRLVDRIEPRSLVVVPLCARGRTIGAMALLSSSGPSFVESLDRTFAAEVASRIALAIDNAKLLRMREDTLSVVSHDLRNPLNVIGFVGAALKRPNVGEEQRFAYADKLKRAAAQMNRLIQDLLDVSRMESGALPVEVAPVAAATLIADAVEALTPIADEKKIRLLARGSDVDCTVIADRERTLQVFSNLVSNAIKFTPAGGSVSVSARDDGHEVRFTVSDTGPGIERESLPRIFDRFFQGKRTAGSAGLGLAIAKGLVFAQKGRIWCESEAGAGATFHVVLPKAINASTTALIGGASEESAPDLAAFDVSAGG